MLQARDLPPGLVHPGELQGMLVDAKFEFMDLNIIAAEMGEDSTDLNLIAS